MIMRRDRRKQDNAARVRNVDNGPKFGLSPNEIQPVTWSGYTFSSMFFSREEEIFGFVP